MHSGADGTATAEHTHEHEHGHTHGHEQVAVVTPDASVAVDIGEGYGALVIYPADSYRGLEIEISPAADVDGRRVHTGVHERATPAGVSRLTALFGSLAAGDYQIWRDSTTEGPVVTVPEATVAEITLD